jgi:hypothetical protein
MGGNMYILHIYFIEECAFHHWLWGIICHWRQGHNVTDRMSRDYYVQEQKKYRSQVFLDVLLQRLRNTVQGSAVTGIKCSGINYAGPNVTVIKSS